MDRKFEILVVDDDLKNIQVGINFLKQNKEYHLVFATSGEQALERVGECDFDLILLDIIMPTMDGYEVCKRLKANKKTQHIPVIFLTAKHEQDSLMKGFELGGADYITKPFNASELNARVQTHLELNYRYKREIMKLQELLICTQQAETINFMAQGIAHDCNNFMTTIAGNVGLLKGNLKKDAVLFDNYEDFFTSVDIAVKKISALLKQFSMYSDKTKVKHEKINMNEVVSDLQKVYKGHGPEEIQFRAKLCCQPAYAMANKLQVEQVLLNLIINAQHAILNKGQKEGDQAVIDLIVESCDGSDHADLADEKLYLKLTVSDSGEGIDEVAIEKIFDPYFSTRKDDGGTGLGLAVSLAIIECHQGVIDVTSILGKGTKFYVYLPKFVE